MSDLSVVTGGAGFIGSHLVALLAERGERVRVIERPEAEVRHLPGSVEVVRADIRDREALGPAFEGSATVYHLAANPNLWARDRREFESVNHQGTKNVLDAALAAGAKRVLHASTESILTKAGASEMIDENVEIACEDAVGPYCLSKLLAEREAFARAQAGAPVVVVNPTMPVGPGDRGLSPPTRLIRDFALGKLPAIMDCTLNLIDVRDIALGMARAIERAAPGRRYLLGGANITLRELLQKVATFTGSKVPRLSVPYHVGLAFAHLSEFWSDHISGEMPKASVTGVRLARRLMHFDASRSLEELGVSPRPIEQSLGDSIAWLRETELLSGRSEALNSRRTAHEL